MNQQSVDCSINYSGMAFFTVRVGIDECCFYRADIQALAPFKALKEPIPSTILTAVSLSKLAASAVVGDNGEQIDQADVSCCQIPEENATIRTHMRDGWPPTGESR